MSVVPLEDEEIHNYQHGFLIKSPEKSFAVYAKSTNDKHNWVNALNQVPRRFHEDLYYNYPWV